jgi:hypothetical protein
MWSRAAIEISQNFGWGCGFGEHRRAVDAHNLPAPADCIY